VWWLAKNHDRFGGGVGYAIDPVCGMQVRINDAPAHSRHAEVNYYFCSDHCREKFESNPLSYTAKTPATRISMDQGSMDQGSMDQGSMDQGSMDQGSMDQGSMDQGSMDHGSMSKATSIDPVCGMEVDPLNATDHRKYRSHDIHFCSVGCATRFDQDPDRYFGPADIPEEMPTSPVVVALSKTKTGLPPTME
jgi:YHS domain-containing protein